MSEQTSERMTKAELTERTQAERKRFLELLDQLSEEQMLQPNVQGAWSVKDIVSHVIDWEERMIRWLGEGMRGETPVMPAPGMTWADLDRLNEQTYLAHVDDPLAQVLADFRGLEPSVLEAIQTVPEDDLLSVDRFPWTDGDPLWHLVAANTFWHYPGHVKSIHKVIEGQERNPR